MSLKIVYGKSGSGKSTYIFKEIAERIKQKNKDFNKIYIITPEQFSFTAEKKLLDSICSDSVVDAEVLTFERMAYRVINEVRRAENQKISSTGRAMLLYNILTEQKDSLKFIGKSSENIDLIAKQITEFKKHNITVENLKKVTENMEDKYLQAKMEDMLLIYDNYTCAIKDSYLDENTPLTILSQELSEINEFKNCHIYIDEFVGFTKQEYEVIRKLLDNQNNVTITICTEDLKISQIPDIDVFYTNKQTVESLLKIAKETNTKIEEHVYLNTNYRFKTPELVHLEKNIYGTPYTKYKGKVENVEIFLAKNPYSEIEQVGAEIVKLVRDKGYRYNDIGVITKNLEGYSNLCKAIFNKYNIPVFIDEKKDLSQNILIRYILAILNIFVQNWSYEAMFEYIKTGFLNLEQNDCSILQNYCLKWGIKGSKWYKGEWNFYNEEQELEEKIKYLREVVITPLIKFKETLAKRKTVKTMTESIYEFLILNNIPQKLEDKIIKLQEEGNIEKANEYETSWRIIVEILDEIVLILGNQIVSFEQYLNILKIGLKNSELGKIPGTQDQVIVGDVNRSRSHKVKAIFIIGLNDGMFPSVNKNEGFFNDKDREELKKKGAELAKGTLENIYEENFNIYKAFSTAEEKVYLSYASSDLGGSSLRASVLINKIRKLFPTIQEKSDVIERESQIITEETTFEELLNKIRNLKDGEEIEPIWFEVYNYYSNNEKWKMRLQNSLNAIDYTNIPDKINKRAVNKLYGDKLKTSVSRLEQYQACPFSYYLKYGLKLTQKNEFKIQTVDTGTFMHEVIDSFFEELSKRGLNCKEIEREEIERLVNDIIEEKLSLKKNYIFTSIPKYRVLANRLRKVLQKSMQYIVDSLKYSKFEVLGHEIEFKQGKEEPPIEIELEDGRKVEITGKIDRIDIAKTEDGNYMRIIDYKSSAKDINLNEVVAGLQLQLLTYLDAVCSQEDLIPSGILYFKLMEPVLKVNKHLDNEEIEAEIRKQFKMKGLVLADVDVVKMMDTKLERGNSDIIPAYINQEGNLSERSSTITRSQFENLQKYTNKLIRKISSEILSGDIALRPYYKTQGGKTPCDYCDYRSICNFNNGICKNSYNYISNWNKEYLLEKIKEDKVD